MRPAFTTLDRYLLAQVAGTLASVFGIVLSLMMFENMPRLFEVVRLTGSKGYVVIQSMFSLLPEYAGIGLLFGLYLAIALTVRRLALREEIDVIEATGIAPRRWMRVPALLALLVAGALVWNQGWLLAAGEKRLAAINHAMRNGQYGYDLESGQFIDFGNGVTVRFDGVDRTTHELLGVFFRTPDTVFTASRGRLGFDLGGDVLVDLRDGRSLDRGNGNALSFASFHFDSGGRKEEPRGSIDATERRKGTALPALLGSADPGDRAAAYARLLWPAFALAVPFLAAVLGRPMRRSNSSLGLLAGVVLLVLFTRTAQMVATAGVARPALLAIAVAGSWLAAAALLVRAERRWGAGFVDRWLLSLAGRLRAGRLLARRGDARGKPAIAGRSAPAGRSRNGYRIGENDLSGELQRLERYRPRQVDVPAL